jgi:hypothetical protein
VLNNNAVRVLLLRNVVRLNHLLLKLASDGKNISHSIQLRSFSTQSADTGRSRDRDQTAQSHRLKNELEADRPVSADA